MTVSINITNENLYSETIVDVDTSGLLGSLDNGKISGDLEIECVNQPIKTHSGEFGQFDYVSDFGFELVIDED